MFTSKLKTPWCTIQKRYASKGSTIIKKEYGKHEISKIRNIGILAHIDAGSFMIYLSLYLTYTNFYFYEFIILILIMIF